MRVVTALVAFLVLDGVWLGVLGPALGVYEGKYEAVSARVPVAVGLYALLAACVVSLVVAPSANERAAGGALLGFLAFATFNLTHWALTPSWDMSVALVDTLYGTMAWAGVALLVGR